MNAPQRRLGFVSTTALPHGFPDADGVIQPLFDPARLASLPRCEPQPRDVLPLPFRIGFIIAASALLWTGLITGVMAVL